MKKYETGDWQIPLPELELLTTLLDIPMKEVSGGQGPVGEWMREQNIVQQLMEMPEELQEFVSRLIVATVAPH